MIGALFMLLDDSQVGGVSFIFDHASATDQERSKAKRGFELKSFLHYKVMEFSPKLSVFQKNISALKGH